MPLEFSGECESAATLLVRMALQEDLRDVGDLTSLSTIPSELNASVNIVSRQSGVVCGLAVMPIVFSEMAANVSFDCHVTDGDTIAAKSVLASLTGPVQALLTAERTVLNFMTLLSGIASSTAQFVKEVQHTKAVILDTRKTFPGYRLLQKYAVRCGGGTNHRMGLYDGILIKDNHIAARRDSTCAAANKIREFESTQGWLEDRLETVVRWLLSCRRIRGSGEIGRRARLRGVWGNPCRFKSCLPQLFPELRL
jgi:nicotinate-nucleotide pyrophosphorylase (carboxylating)